MAEAYKFQSLHEVPAPWQNYKGARLSLEQIQWIVDKSFELSGNNSAMATARQEFEKDHHIQNSIWVDGPPPKEGN